MDDGPPNQIDRHIIITAQMAASAGIDRKWGLNRQFLPINLFRKPRMIKNLSYGVGKLGKIHKHFLRFSWVNTIIEVDSN